MCEGMCECSLHFTTANSDCMETQSMCVLCVFVCVYVLMLCVESLWQI